jgi:hypothetical protein
MCARLDGSDAVQEISGPSRAANRFLKRRHFGDLRRPPVVIGATYNFEGAGPNGEDIVGVVSDAYVVEAEKAVIITVSRPDGSGFLLREPMSDRQFADYKAHPDAYFGKVGRPPKKAETPQDLFEFFMDAYKELPRDKLLKHLNGRLPSAEQMDVDELRAVYCEGLVSMSALFEIVEPGDHLATEGPAHPRRRD